MRVSIDFILNNQLELPIQYNHILHALILKSLDNKQYQKFIHDTGYEVNKRKYKMYTFSKLQGKFRLNKEKRTVTYFNKATLLISSYDEKFTNFIINNIACKDTLEIKGQQAAVGAVETSFFNVQDEELKVYTKSPITVYSTFEKDGKNKTYYYSPYESEFSELIRNNLIKKYKAYHGKEPENKNLSIELLNRRKPKESVVIYKGILVKGWNGEYIMRGSKELLNLAYNAGVGSKNSQGFGCIELIRDY